MFSKIKNLVNRPKATAESTALELKKAGDACLQQGDLEQAAAFYTQSLTAFPQAPDTHVALAYTYLERGMPEAADRHLQQAIALHPENADAHFMQGNIARDRGDTRSAIAHHERVIAIDPGFVFAYRELMNTYRALGDLPQLKQTLERAMGAFPDAAEFCFELAGAYFAENNHSRVIHYLQQALRLDPDNTAGHLNLAKTYIATGQDTLAIPSLERVAGQTPDDAATHHLLGNAYLKAGRKPEALASFREVLRLEPDSPLKHLIEAFSGNTTHTAPAAYVEQLFDQYADTFDDHLVQSLAYHTPTELLSLIRAHGEPEAHSLDVLDLGCGTGLFGREIAPFARRLAGVDLSAKMLDKARQAGVYQRLERQDLRDMMRGESPASYDLIAATDVFIYVGALEDLVVEAKRLLRPNGLLAFSAESMDALSSVDARAAGAGFVLCDTGRYAHALTYLNRLAATGGFRVAETRAHHCRIENGRPIMGYLTLWVRTDAD